MKRIFALAFSFVSLVGCSSSDESAETSTSTAALSGNVADHGCRVFLFDAGIPSHGMVDGDFNSVQAVDARNDASGRAWWPFAADVGVGQYVDRSGVTVGVLYSVDGHVWSSVETKTVARSVDGTPVYHLEWGDGLFPFAASSSLAMCPPGTLHDCLAAQPGLAPMQVEAYVRMPDGTTYWDHNAANADQGLANDMSSVRLDATNAWQAPARDLLHCLQPGT